MLQTHVGVNRRQIDAVAHTYLLKEQSGISFWDIHTTLILDEHVN